jgi:hypothetical protein
MNAMTMRVRMDPEAIERATKASKRLQEAHKELCDASQELRNAFDDLQYAFQIIPAGEDGETDGGQAVQPPTS